MDIFPTLADIAGIPRSAMLDPIDGIRMERPIYLKHADEMRQAFENK